MKEENKLYEKYPKLFRQKDLPASETCMCWGIACGNGWYNIIEEACEKLQKLADETNCIIEFAQIKEKYAGLRLYLDIDQQTQTTIDVVTTQGIMSHTNKPSNPVWEAAHKITREAEDKSIITCEVCGKPGKARQGGWISTLCDEHSKEKEEA